MLPAPALGGALRATWTILLVAIAWAWLAPAADAQQPVADFTVSPASPMEGERATFVAVLPEGEPRGTVLWDFAGRADLGRRARHTFARAGEKAVTMRWIRRRQVVATVTKTVVVIPRPPGEEEPEEPEEGPEPPEHLLPPNPPEGPPGRLRRATTRQPPAGDDQGPAVLMAPFPVVRIAGVLVPWGARVRLLSVREPARSHGDGSLPRERLSAGAPAPSLPDRARPPPKPGAHPAGGHPPGDIRAPERADRQVHPLQDPGRRASAAQSGPLPGARQAPAGPLSGPLATSAPSRIQTCAQAGGRRASARL